MNRTLDHFFKGQGDGDNQVRFNEVNETVQALLPTNKVIPIGGATANVYSIGMEIKEQITNCSVSSITPCIESFYDKKFGNSYEDLIGKSNFYFKT